MRFFLIAFALIATLLGANTALNAQSTAAKAKKLPNFSFYNALNGKVVTAHYEQRTLNTITSLEITEWD